MYQILYDMIGYNMGTQTNYHQYIIYGCITLIIIFSVCFIDLIYRIFSSFWRGKNK